MSDDPPAQDAADGAVATEATAETESPFAALEMQPDGPPARLAVPDPATEAMAGDGLGLVLDVPIRLSVELGRTDIPIRDVVNLGRGSIIELDRGPGMPLDVRVNGVLIGRGEVVLVNEERLGLRFVEVVSQAERVKRAT